MAEGEQEQDSQEDRADRLSRRRKDRPQSSESGNASETDNTVKTDSTDNTGSTDESDETDATSSVNLTDSRKEQMMHLPEGQHKELHHIYNQVKTEYEYEYEEDFEMNRHYFPLVLQYGLEEVEQRDIDELRDDLSLSEDRDD